MFNKVIFYKEFEAPIKYGYLPEHMVKSYLKITRKFTFKEGFYYTVETNNFYVSSRTLIKSLVIAFERSEIGNAKYNRLKTDLKEFPNI